MSTPTVNWPTVSDIEGASEGNYLLNQALTLLLTQAQSQARQSGFISESNPTAAYINVQGGNGQFNITLTVPSNAVALTLTQKLAGAQQALLPGQTMVHQLQASLDAAFGTNDTTTYGGTTGSAQLSYVISNANATIFWRVRSSFDGINWSVWRIANSGLAIQSGAVGSGSLLPGIPLNSTNNCTVDSIDAGSSATARIYGPSGVGTSWIRQSGSGTQTTYPSGTVTGLAYATTYWVFLNILTNPFAFVAVTALSSAMPDGYVFCGKIVTLNAGGAPTASATAVGYVSGSPGGVTGVQITGGGSGYTVAPSVSFGGGGSGAVGIATISGGAVTGVSMTNSGSGYTPAGGPPPTITVSFTGGGAGTSGGGGASFGNGGRLLSQ